MSTINSIFNHIGYVLNTPLIKTYPIIWQFSDDSLSTVPPTSQRQVSWFSVPYMQKFSRPIKINKKHIES